jgi:hypothetical protein
VVAREKPGHTRALFLNRFMFGIVIIIWLAFVGVALVRGTLVLARVASMLVIILAGAGYLLSRHRSAIWHRALGITANALVVCGVVYMLVARQIGQSLLDGGLVVLSVGVLFAYPLVLLTRGWGMPRGRSGARA